MVVGKTTGPTDTEWKLNRRKYERLIVTFTGKILHHCISYRRSKNRVSLKGTNTILFRLPNHPYRELQLRRAEYRTDSIRNSCAWNHWLLPFAEERRQTIETCVPIYGSTDDSDYSFFVRVRARLSSYLYRRGGPKFRRSNSFFCYFVRTVDHTTKRIQNWSCSNHRRRKDFWEPLLRKQNLERRRSERKSLRKLTQKSKPFDFRCMCAAEADINYVFLYTTYFV